MAKVGQRNTKPELVVRQLLHRLGYRFRLHRTDLPGSPDIVLPRYRVAIFVDGCFWHGHSCRAGRLPASRVEYWTQKISANQERDRRQTRELRRLGWTVVRVWSCELRNLPAIEKRLSKKLGSL